jgi:cbb3-type cytochrome oxidase subunit 3
MKLSDVMGAAGLSIYAQIALLIFLVTFVGIVVWVFLPRHKQLHERARHMPLDDERPQTPRTGGD